MHCRHLVGACRGFRVCLRGGGWGVGVRGGAFVNMNGLICVCSSAPLAHPCFCALQRCPSRMQLSLHVSPCVHRACCLCPRVRRVLWYAAFSVSTQLQAYNNRLGCFCLMCH